MVALDAGRIIFLETFSSKGRPPMSHAASSTETKKSVKTLWLVVAVCLAPVVASYILYYGVRPEGRTNYGELLTPQHSVEGLSVDMQVRPGRESGFVDVLERLDEKDPRRQLKTLGDFRGRWLLLRVGPAGCDAICEQQLWLMRQLRLTTGRERDRVERVWLVPDKDVISEAALGEFEGTWVARIDPSTLEAWPRSEESANGLQRHIWLVDPLGNLMMRFPMDPDPAKMKKDLLKLLKASRVG